MNRTLMGNAPHTPGPLTARRNVGVALGADSLEWVVGNGSVYTALVGIEEDANLYAAAPDLLKGCKLLLADLIPRDKDAEQFVSVMEARAAIAKALGTK